MDSKNLAWSRRLSVTLNISKTQLLRIVPVDKHVAASKSILGVKSKNIRIIIGTSDGVSSNYVFQCQPEAAVLSIRTSHAVQMISDQPLLNPELHNFAYRIEEESYLIGLPSNSGSDIFQGLIKIFKASFEELD